MAHLSLTSASCSPRKGKVCLDGVRFLRTEHTTPVEVCKAVQPKEFRDAKEVSGVLQRVKGQAGRSAAVKNGFKMGEVLMNISEKWVSICFDHE